MSLAEGLTVKGEAKQPAEHDKLMNNFISGASLQVKELNGQFILHSNHILIPKSQLHFTCALLIAGLEEAYQARMQVIVGQSCTIMLYIECRHGSAGGHHDLRHCKELPHTAEIDTADLAQALLLSQVREVADVGEPEGRE